VRIVEDPAQIGASYGAYLRDESNLGGEPPRRIWFPGSAGELSKAVREIGGRGESLTVSGARTGIVGGAVPSGAANLVSLEKAVFPPSPGEGLEGARTVRVGAGTTLAGLAEILRNGGLGADAAPLAYPVDPTETTASVGGSIATNASGARTFRYGPTRSWIAALTVVLSDGSIARLRRRGPPPQPAWRAVATGAVERGADAKTLPFEAVSPSGDPRRIELDLPDLRIPATKHAAGYWLVPGMDPVDLFIGGEGTLGIVAEAELILCPAPSSVVSLCIFLPDGFPEGKLAVLLADAKGIQGTPLLSIESMDAGSIRLLAAFRAESGESSRVPPLPDVCAGALFLEAECGTDAGMENFFEKVQAILESHGISADAAWAALDAKELESMKAFRHALPERINSIIGRRKADVPGITKVAADLAVPDHALPRMLSLYGSVLAERGLESAIFGHIGNAHLHVNILPRSGAEMESGREACAIFAREAVRLGGSVSGEHGIGRLKKHLLEIQFSAQELAGMKRIKAALDPAGILNPGVLW
jgi:D-lactate dehydrogenase (cytochrome)